MSKFVYVCNYCGEILIADGDKKSPQDHEKCEKCGSSQFTGFIENEIYQSMKSRNANLERIMNFRFSNLIPQWEEHKRQGITPTSGETPMPKCPTCGSENIRRISQNERSGNALMFGLYGNKRKYQFECLNKSCGYKW